MNDNDKLGLGDRNDFPIKLYRVQCVAPRAYQLEGDPDLKPTAKLVECEAVKRTPTGQYRVAHPGYKGRGELFTVWQLNTFGYRLSPEEAMAAAVEDATKRFRAAELALKEERLRLDALDQFGKDNGWIN